MKHKATKLFATALLSATVTALTASADDHEVVELDEIVVEPQSLFSDQVNALKTPTPIIDVPQSLSIIDSDELKVRGFDEISDIIAYTPGVNISQGEGHRDAVVFRGVRSTADFFVDGVRDDVQYYRPLYNIEQVEILRGPNALLFGRGGAGGILNRVTKKAELGEEFIAYELSIDTFGSYEAQLDGNVALGEDSAFRINAYYDAFENHRDFSDGDGFGVNPTFKFALSEKTTLDISYEYLDYDRSIDRGIPTGTDFEPVDALNDIVFGDPDLNNSEFEAHIFRALVQHQFSDTLKGNLTMSYGDYDKLYENFYAADYDQTVPDEVLLDGYIDTTERQNFVLSGNLVGEFETGDIGHTLIFGAEYINSSSENDRFNPDFDPDPVDTEDQATFLISQRNIAGVGFNAGGLDAGPFTDLNDDTETDLDVFSLYVQDEIKLLEQLTLVLGARFDSFDISVKDNKPGGTDGSQKDEEFTPRAGLIFKPEENISFYLSYSETFLPQSGEQFANLGDEGLDPDEYTNLEAGLKWDFSQGLSFTAAIFQIDQDFVSDDGMGGSESSETEITGFEAQVLGQITEKWYLSAGYSYLEGELDNGNTPRELPENMFSIWNSYQLTEQFVLGLGAIYQDSSYITNDEDTELPSFVRVDAAAYYQINENLRLQVNIENLFDEEYYPSAHSDHQATVGAPINARFAITGRF
ncbi:MAG: TonB-dependent siderophore receptor [Verrucomicrobiota bacterium]